ncbi:MAG: 16S rRNA (cytidine(1402)-2'-O)-methyltransferase [Chlamydiae bacterium]|nr:16S rRNA (cytidine(1402)-2'-O)-methyltransferase [Chlamydiota bacterium]
MQSFHSPVRIWVPPFLTPCIIVLYIIPTPIGNLKDITYRAVETLSFCDYILCEDTRHSSHLLKHYQIQKPLVSYHQFNEASRIEKIIEDLQNGKHIALISDSGTPGICDPGAKLIKKCREIEIPMSALPGACAVTTTFCLWGQESPFFQFLGFFPRKEKDIHTFLLRALCYQGLSLFYESPQRILDTLEIFNQRCPSRKLLIARELSKSFEEVRFGTASDHILHFTHHSPKGEFVLCLDPQESDPFEGLDIPQLLQLLKDSFGLSSTEAIKSAAHIRNQPKQSIYKIVHSKKE